MPKLLVEKEFCSTFLHTELKSILLRESGFPPEAHVGNVSLSMFPQDKTIGVRLRYTKRCETQEQGDSDG